MFKYCLGFALITPLLGMILVESGAYCWQCGRFGYPNGASIAFAAYALTVLLTFAIVIRLRSRTVTKQTVAKQSGGSFVSLALVILIVNTLFLFTLLFGAGGIRVLLGEAEKINFRVKLGLLGALSFWILKYLAPSSLAYLAVIYRRSRAGGFAPKVLLGLNLLMVSLIGLAWGFKTSALIILLPSLLILYWTVSLRQMAVLLLVALLITVGTAVFFDRSDYRFQNLRQVLVFIGTRATVLQGDVAWHVWDLYRNGEALPDYWRTLLPFVGDRLFSILSGITRDNFSLWASYHYESALTHLAGYPLEDVEQGLNTTATPFAEGVIALGAPGFLLFGVIAGAVSAANYSLIKSALAEGRARTAAIASTYFGWIVFPWLNGGGITVLFHISVFIGIFLSYMMLISFEFLAPLLGTPPARTERLVMDREPLPSEPT